MYFRPMNIARAAEIADERSMIVMPTRRKTLCAPLELLHLTLICNTNSIKSALEGIFTEKNAICFYS